MIDPRSLKPWIAPEISSRIRSGFASVNSRNLAAASLTASPERRQELGADSGELNEPGDKVA